VRELEHAIHRAVVLARATRSGDEVVIHARHFALHDETAAVARLYPRCE
jgi:anaerobic nitric oxide reductase transcription regulator